MNRHYKIGDVGHFFFVSDKKWKILDDLLRFFRVKSMESLNVRTKEQTPKIKYTAHGRIIAYMRMSQQRQAEIVKKFLDCGGNTEMVRIERSILK